MKSKLYLSGINSCYNVYHIDNELININRTIDLFGRLLNENDISFDEYIDIINKIYNIEITANDLIRISSCILGSNCKYSILDTDILCDVTRRNQIGNFFEYLDEVHKLYVKVAFTDAIDDTSRKYSYNEIVELSNENKIMILELILDDEGDSYEEITEFGRLSTLKDFVSSFTRLKYLEKEYIPSIYCFLKEYFSIDRLNNDFNFYMYDVRRKLDLLDKNIANVKKGHYSKNLNLDNISLECKRIKQRKISKDN